MFHFQSNDELIISEEKQFYNVIVNKTPAEIIFPLTKILKQTQENLHKQSDAWSISEIEEAGRAQIGDEFLPIDGYKKINSNSDQIIHKQGQILVLHYCNVSKEDCVSSMEADNQFLKSKRAQWGDQVKMIGLNVSQQKHCLDFIELVKNLEEIEQYFPINCEDRPETLRYHAYQWPYYVIIDKEGKIAHLGRKGELEEIVQNLINPKQIMYEQQQIIQKQQIKQEQIESLIQFLLQSKDALKEMGDSTSFGFQVNFIVMKESEADDAKFVEVKLPYIQYWVRSNKIEQLNKLLRQIYKIVPKECFNVDETISQVIDIPFPGKECAVCKVGLNDQISQYYSPLKSEFVCLACAEFDDKTQIGLARFKYIDTLLFIQAPLTDLSILKNFDEYKLGQNLSDPYYVQHNQRFALRCRGCDPLQEGLRYMAINSKPGIIDNFNVYMFCIKCYKDFCYKCFVILQDRNSQRAKAILERCDLEEYSMQGLFLRVIYLK